MEFEKKDNNLEIAETKKIIRSIEDIKARIESLNRSIVTLQNELAIENELLKQCNEFGIKESNVN